MADVVEDIKSRLSIEDVVSQYVQLKKAGRSFKGLCPFHSEKTPSFVVSLEKQICHCFGCNKGGDIFGFIQEIEGVPFAQALEILADKAGLKIDKKKLDKKNFSSDKEPYYTAHDFACEFFEEKLQQTIEGKKVLEYLYKRGLTDETIKEFRLGFAPDEFDALYPMLIKKGVSKEVLLKSGLVSAKNISSQEIYDKFRLRLMFPIFDAFGKICGFGGRALKQDQSPKYLNSPDSPIYNKSNLLYGFYQAKKSIKEKDQAIFVEGYFDVILPYQSGVKNVVAGCGTALTLQQIRLVKRLTTNMLTCFDCDDAGFEASKRSYFIFQSENILPRILQFKDAKDPADFVKENPSELPKLIKEAKDFISFFLEHLLKNHKADTLEGRRKILDELLPIYKQLTPVIRDGFVKDLALRVGISEKNLYEELDRYNLPMHHPARQVKEELENVSTYKLEVEELLIAVVLQNPKLFEVAKLLLDEKDFSSDMKEVYKALLHQYNAVRGQLESWNLDSDVLASIRAKVSVMMLFAEEKYSRFTEITLDLELRKLIDKIKESRRTRGLRDIQGRILEAEKSGDFASVKELLKEQQSLLNS